MVGASEGWAPTAKPDPPFSMGVQVSETNRHLRDRVLKRITMGAGIEPGCSFLQVLKYSLWLLELLSFRLLQRSSKGVPARVSEVGSHAVDRIGMRHSKETDLFSIHLGSGEGGLPKVHSSRDQTQAAHSWRCPGVTPPPPSTRKQARGELEGCLDRHCGRTMTVVALAQI